MPANRKRFNAFDDFDPQPETGMPVPLTPAATSSSPRQPVERIERLKPSQMIPDRFQPRRLLPAILRQDFFSGRKSCYDSASLWLELGRQDPGIQAELERLLAMGSSFEEHGQIKPITGAWVEDPNGGFIFQIETGERRFWAACLRAVLEQKKDEPLLRVEVVEKPTRQRQVLENRHAEPPSAVGQACEVASLILAELNIFPDPSAVDEFDYFRQVHAQRMPAGLWDRIMPVMQLTRPRMVQLLNILNLPTRLLETADRFRLPERVLREVLSLPPERRESMLNISIQQHMTAEDVAEIARQPSLPSSNRQPGGSPYPAKTALNGLRRFARAITDLEDDFSRSQALDQVADELVGRREAEGMLNLLGELAHVVQMRLTRK